MNVINILTFVITWHKGYIFLQYRTTGLQRRPSEFAVTIGLDILERNMIIYTTYDCILLAKFRFSRFFSTWHSIKVTIKVYAVHVYILNVFEGVRAFYLNKSWTLLVHQQYPIENNCLICVLTWSANINTLLCHIKEMVRSQSQRSNYRKVQNN